LIPTIEEVPPYLDFLVEGDIEANHFIPKHPFILEAVWAYFLGEGGTVEINIYADVARSWPHAKTTHYWPEEDVIYAGGRFDVPADAGWVRFELSEPLIFLPHEHFWIGYRHLDASPYLGLGNPTDEAELTQSMYYSDKRHDRFVWDVPGGVFMLRAEGKHFCKRETTWFTDATDSAGLSDLTHMRTAFGDVDGDGYDDLLLHLAHDGTVADSARLFKNNGDGTFTDITSEAGLTGFYSNLAAIADFDNDGDEDIYLGVYIPQDEDFEDHGKRSTILENDGTGHFTEVADAGVGYEGTTSAVAVADFDGDSYLDLFVGNWLIEYPQPPSICDWLFFGNGDLTFTDVSDMLTDQECRPCYGAEAADYDNDGDMDIFVANYGRTDNYLWENRGDSFVDVAPQRGVAYHVPGTGGNTFSAAWEDYDCDGDLDLYLAEIAHPRYQPSSDPSSFNVNSGPPDFEFEDMREDLGIPWDEGEIEVSFVDFDNDGDLDLMLSDLYMLHFARLFRQNDDGKFEEVTYLAGIDVHEATNHAWSDIDRDGDLDLVITHRRSDVPNRVRLYINEIGTDNHWLAIKLVGTDSNRDAVGARAYLTACGKTQMRHVKSSRGHFGSQSTLVLHFGLGDCTEIESLDIKWPSGLEQSFDDLEVDNYYILEEGSEPEFWTL
ncbi:MAG TPA: CRTAC1 family protein, partial [Proteobacteria bacterium]|nr:CRTAC1 family protein [Pseudomonadota bacterium]